MILWNKGVVKKREEDKNISNSSSSHLLVCSYRRQKQFLYINLFKLMADNAKQQSRGQ
jgi:hypothetical protein